VDSCKYCKSPISHDSNILFCPQCGANIFDLEQEVKRRRKDGTKKVSIKWQILFSIIPLMPLVAAYRLRKLRKAFLIYVIAAALPFFAILIFNTIVDTQYSSIRQQALSDPTALERFSSFLTFYDDFWKGSFAYLFGASLYLVSSLVMIYFIRKWSIGWNKEIALLKYLE
jgi:hypothetical protein